MRAGPPAHRGADRRKLLPAPGIAGQHQVATLTQAMSNTKTTAESAPGARSRPAAPAGGQGRWPPGALVLPRRRTVSTCRACWGTRALAAECSRPATSAHGLDLPRLLGDDAGVDAGVGCVVAGGEPAPESPSGVSTSCGGPERSRMSAGDARHVRLSFAKGGASVATEGPTSAWAAWTHHSVDAIVINDEIDLPSTATPASCGYGRLKRLLAAPFNAKAKPSMLTM